MGLGYLPLFNFRLRLTRRDVTEGTGQAIYIEIYGELGEKSQVLEHLVKISAERACPAQSMVNHAHFNHPEKCKASVFDSVFDLKMQKILEKNKRAPCHQKNQILIFKNM